MPVLGVAALNTGNNALYLLLALSLDIHLSGLPQNIHQARLVYLFIYKLCRGANMVKKSR